MVLHVHERARLECRERVGRHGIADVRLWPQLLDSDRLLLVDPGEEPELGGRKLDSRATSELLVGFPAILATRERAERPLELAEGAVVSGRCEALADAVRARGLRKGTSRSSQVSANATAREIREVIRQLVDARSRERASRTGACTGSTRKSYVALS
jgi:hypothetical protein